MTTAATAPGFASSFLDCFPPPSTRPPARLDWTRLRWAAILLLYIRARMHTPINLHDSVAQINLVLIHIRNLVLLLQEKTLVEIDRPGAAMEKPPIPTIISTVTYCCGACGYDLRLSSLARAGAGAGARRRCVGAAEVVFDAIDDARFGHLEEFRWLDVRACLPFSRRTRLLCRKCGARLGYGYHDAAADDRPPTYHIKIRALRPSPDPDPPAAPSDP